MEVKSGQRVRTPALIGERRGSNPNGSMGVVPGEGFEPPTFGLQNRCTTTVLTRLPIGAGPTQRETASGPASSAWTMLSLKPVVRAFPLPRERIGASQCG